MLASILAAVVRFLTGLERYLLRPTGYLKVPLSVPTGYQAITFNAPAKSRCKSTKNWSIRNLAFSPLTYLYNRVDNHEEI